MHGKNVKKKNTMRWVRFIVVDNIQYCKLQRAQPLAPEPGCLGIGTSSDMLNI